MNSPASTHALLHPSLLASAIELGRAVDAVEAGGSISTLHAAIRQAMIAVEQELVGASGGPGMLDDVAIREPRLRPAIERLEVGLAEMLVRLWQIRVSVPGTTPSSSELLAVARKLRQLADNALNLFHESMLPVGGGH